MQASTRSGIDPEVLVLELLALGRPGAEQRAAGVDEIRPREVEVRVNEEVFLFGPARRVDPLGPRAEQLQDADRLNGEGLHRAKQRRLLVERLSRPAHEGRWDGQRHAVRIEEQPGRARRVPRGIAAGLERAAHAARREARRVGFAPDELLAAELGDGAAFGRRRQEGIVLLGGNAREWLKPVREMRRTVLDGPVFHRRCHRIGRREVEGFASCDRASQRLVDGLGQASLLGFIAKDAAAEDLRSAAVHGQFPALGHRPTSNRIDCFTCRC